MHNLRYSFTLKCTVYDVPLRRLLYKGSEFSLVFLGRTKYSNCLSWCNDDSKKTQSDIILCDGMIRTEKSDVAERMAVAMCKMRFTTVVHLL